MACEHTGWYTETIANYVQLHRLDLFRVAGAVVDHVPIDLIFDRARPRSLGVSELLSRGCKSTKSGGRQVVYNLLVSNAQLYNCVLNRFDRSIRYM